MKVLLVSIAFPPKRDPESLQVAKYCKYLKEIKSMDLEIITSKDPTLFMEPDNTLLEYRTGLRVIQEVKIFENRYLNFLIRKLNPAFLQYPDSKFSFWRQHKTIGRKMRTKPDILYSRSYPVSSTLLALELKKKWQIPWVLHLSDPWAIASSNDLSPATNLIGKARDWNSGREMECFQLADKICFTSRKTIALYQNAYPHLTHKFFYAPNVYDDSVMELNPPDMKGKLKIVYTGGFGEARSPYPLLEAISRFYIAHENLAKEKTEFLFTGEMTRANQAIFEQYKTVSVIKHLGVIPYKDVVSLQKSAHLLVNIDSDIKDPVHAVFFPSKLLDYMVAHRRILAITNPHSTTHEVVHKKLGDSFEFSNIDALAEYFMEVLNRYLQNDISFFYRPDTQQEFSARHNASRMAELFLSLKKTV